MPARHAQVDRRGEGRRPGELHLATGFDQGRHRLALVQLVVGVPEHPLDVGAVLGIGGDPGRDSRAIAEAGTDSLCDCARVVLDGAWQQQPELVAAKPSHDVARPHLGVQRPRDPAQQLVSGRVPADLVDLREVVDVERDERERATARAARQLRVEPLHEATAIEGAGQRVCARHTVELEPAPLGVARVQRADHGGTCEADGEEAELHVRVGALGEPSGDVGELGQGPDRNHRRERVRKRR